MMLLYKQLAYRSGGVGVPAANSSMEILEQLRMTTRDLIRAADGSCTRNQIFIGSKYVCHFSSVFFSSERLVKC